MLRFIGSVQLFIEKKAKNGNQIIRHTDYSTVPGADGSLVPLTMFCRLVTAPIIRSV